MLQRVKAARVTVAGQTIGQIGAGLVVLLGVRNDDEETDVQYIVEKIAKLRIFEDAQGKMNLSVLDLRQELLVVSQFTLYGDSRKGRRPSFSEAAGPEKANALYRQVVDRLKALGLRVETGQFKAYMQVEILNDGPVTLLLDSRRQF